MTSSKLVKISRNLLLYPLLDSRERSNTQVTVRSYNNINNLSLLLLRYFFFSSLLENIYRIEKEKKKEERRRNIEEPYKKTLGTF